MMRLFLYLVALVAGFSPAEAGRVAMAEPVAVGTLSRPAEARSALPTRKAVAHALFLEQPGAVPMVQPQRVTSGHQPLFSTSVELTDRPRA